MRTADNNDVFILVLGDALHCFTIAVSLQEVVSQDNSVFPLLHEREPVFVERWVQALPSAVGQDDSLGSKLDCSFNI